MCDENPESDNSDQEQMDDAELKNIIQALLFVSDQPIGMDTLHEVLPEVSREKTVQMIEQLQKDLEEQNTGLHLKLIAGGYEISTKVKYDPWIRKFLRREKKKRLTTAALETLAIIAYRQPVTSSEIEDIRGVNASGVLKTLLEKHPIKASGRKPVAGRPFLYKTTGEFLRHFGLNSLKDLPRMEDFGEIFNE